MEKVIVYLTASTFFGGPERQMLGLARELPSEFRSVFLLFHEGGRFRPFLEELGRHAIRAIPLQNDTPHLFAAVRELAEGLRGQGAGLVCCNGYKANLLGRLAARRHYE